MLPDITEGSLKSRALNGLYKWAQTSGNYRFAGRVFHSAPTKHAKVSYAPRSIADEVKPEAAGEMLHLGSYNYAALNMHPDVLQASIDAVKNFGTTSSGVRLLNGTTVHHLALENALAAFLGKEEVVTFSSGYAANIAVFSSLISPGDVVLSDELNHASIMDGLALSGGEIVKFDHASHASLAEKLATVETDGRIFIVSDGVFSMDGDIPPLDEYAKLSRQYGAFIIIDDAHGLGAVGPNGRGTVAKFGLEDDVAIITGSLSKGLPAVGGFAAGSSKAMNLLRSGSHPYVFSASLPPGTAAAVTAGIKVLTDNPQIQDQIQKMTAMVKNGLDQIGLDTGLSASAVIPVMMPNKNKTFEVCGFLQDRGIYTNPVCFPAVPLNAPRLRMNITADLTEHDVVKLLAAFAEAKKEFDL